MLFIFETTLPFYGGYILHLATDDPWSSLYCIKICAEMVYKSKFKKKLSFLYSLMPHITITVFIRINTPSLLIVPPPPPFSIFGKFIFWGFTSLPSALRFRDTEKKMHLSTSPIEYRLREIKKITTKHGNFDHRGIKICRNTK